MTQTWDETHDVVVVGSGGGGLGAALTAAIKGLDVLVVEKDVVFGGTTALSGGVLWVPGNGKFPEGDVPAGRSAEDYLRHEAGNSFDGARVREFLDAGPRMVAFMERETSAVRFQPAHGFSDYHPDAPGGVSTGRSIAPVPYDAGELGREVKRLRPPLAEITLMGMMLNASEDVKHFFNATKSLKSFWHVSKLIARYGRDLVVHQRATRLTNGNALIARLARSFFDCGGEIRTATTVEALVPDEQGRVVGIEARSGEKTYRIGARCGVVLAAGGFPQDKIRRSKLFRHEADGEHHLSPAPAGNVGDGISLGESVGGEFDTSVAQPAAWIPVSRVPDKRRLRVFPHLIDRYKPGVIMVNRNGRRFTNEANSYHDVGQAMQADTPQGGETFAWLIADHRAIRKYGLGFVKPAPFLLKPYLASGYLLSGQTPADLASKMGVDPASFSATIETYNKDAVRGEDPEFGRGASSYNRYLGDPEHKPNPCVAALATGPYYAIRMVLGDLGTFAGLATNERSQVLRADKQPIEGLYAVGNDALSIMGGNYPGGGITLGPAMVFGFLIGEQLADSTHLAD
jgi:succinate dehydrogenase/fumarate reductase flavoprotein subunit